MKSNRGGFAFAATFVWVMPMLSAEAQEILCTTKGPEVSEDLLELTDFEVSGPKPATVQDKIAVKFTLRNYGQYPLTFGKTGVFVSALDPLGNQRTFANMYLQNPLDPGQSVTLQDTVLLNQIGKWILWPGYHLVLATAADKFGPDQWNACTLEIQDPSPSTLTWSRTPQSPKLGDILVYEFQASDPDGVQLIQLWLDGKVVKSCAATSCRAVWGPITHTPEEGAAAIDMGGRISTQGQVPPEGHAAQDWWFDDDDGDGEMNLSDNCRQAANAGQEDTDADGVGDACDECDVVLFCSGYEGYFYNHCMGSQELRDFESEGRSYLDVYDLVTRSGCGCLDVDSGLNYFTAGGVQMEEVGGWRHRIAGNELCHAWTDCPVVSLDSCEGNQLTEYACETGGIASHTVTCPAGCSQGACNCPDSDGGRDHYNRGTINSHTDTCLDENRLQEYFCQDIDSGSLIEGFEIVTCPYGCQNGACVCTDSDGGLDYTVAGGIGTLRDSCLDERRLREYTARLGDNQTCAVSSQIHQCDGRCVNGACLAPSCSDGILNQGEVGTDCGGPCTRCGYRAAKGRILFEDADATGTTSKGFFPVRFGKFKIYGCKDNSCNNLRDFGIFLTDSTGYFHHELPISSDNPALHVWIRIGRWDVDDGSFNYASRVLRDLDYCDEYVWFDSYTVAVPATGDIEMGELKVAKDTQESFWAYWKEQRHHCLGDLCICGGSTHSIDGGSVYFNIANTLLRAREYADGKRADGDSIGRVWLEYPDSGGDMFYYDNVTHCRIKIKQASGFFDGAICHEFGHHLQYKISDHDVRVPYWDTAHTFCTDKDDSEFGWSEGFAEYYGTIVPRRYSSELDGSDVAECWVEDPACIDGTVCGNADLCCSSIASDMENGAAAVLWDLVDEPGADFPQSRNEPHDTVSGMEELIFDIFDNELDNKYDAPDLCEFIQEGLNCRLSASELSAIRPILDHIHVGCSSSCGDVNIEE